MTQAQSTQADLSTFLRALAFDLFLSFAPLESAEVAPEATAREGGWCLGHAPPAADELLYAHHKLRC